IVWLGTRAVITHHLTAGELLVFMSYLKSMYSPVRQLAKLAGAVTRGQAAAERIGEVLDADEAVPEQPDAIVVRTARGSLALQGVGFGYPGRPPALSGVDLQVAPGAHLGLVGATGSGKSTLLRLLVRFIDPTQGAVLLDGVDLRSLELESLRRQVALVAQEPYIFKGSLWENIAYGSPSPSRRSAVAAAEATGVDAVLAALPNGYDTAVSERGGSLSGGQRQCVAIARAMARDPRILLLDEPVTGLDAEAQAVVLEALSLVAQGRTTITVSHQLDHLADVDQIAVLERGRIVELGTRAELLGAEQAYWRLHSASRAFANRNTRRPQHLRSTGGLRVGGEP
ncbi:MAG: ABC transporter ATP-binding protein, partial [Acidimicrobiales bacterium]